MTDPKSAPAGAEFVPWAGLNEILDRHETPDLMPDYESPMMKALQERGLS